MQHGTANSRVEGTALGERSDPAVLDLEIRSDCLAELPRRTCPAHLGRIDLTKNDVVSGVCEGSREVAAPAAEVDHAGCTWRAARTQQPVDTRPVLAPQERAIGLDGILLEEAPLHELAQLRLRASGPNGSLVGEVLLVLRRRHEEACRRGSRRDSVGATVIGATRRYQP